MNWNLILAAAEAYLLGAIPFGYLFVRYTMGQDVRTLGSGNIGATNVHRTAGRKAGIAVLVLDIAKGFLAVFIAAKLTGGSPMGLAVGALAVMAGHAFPVFLGFKGGKAVASFIGAFLFIAPVALAAVLGVFVVVVALTKYVSLASMVSALLFPIAVWLILDPERPILIAAIIAGLFIVYRHKANISRLAQGKESVFSFKGGGVKPA
jgi:acyl phosphate:glycerol-3-phosphate acyltransferase